MSEQTYIDPIQIQRVRVAVDAVVIAKVQGDLFILLIKRQYEPFKEFWALPGGFLHTDEELEDGVLRELREETSISADIDKSKIKQIGTFGKLKRDPRPQRVISIAYRIDLDVIPEVHSANEVLDLEWLPISELNNIKFAFDHREIIEKALKM
jgi:8-oxo-dGTP diphosphatase